VTEEELRTRAGGGGRRVRARAAEGRRLAAVEKEAEPGGDGEGRRRAVEKEAEPGGDGCGGCVRLEGDADG